jgi:flagellin
VSLSLVSNNAAALNAANIGLGGLNTSLQRLSTGLTINTGAASPATLAIASAQATRIATINTSIQNTNTAVGLVQTGVGALNQISSLLSQMRGEALDAVTLGSTDPVDFGADKAQISNAIATIGTITKATTFAGQALFSNATAPAVSSTAPAGDPASKALAITAAFGQQSQQDMADIANADFTAAGGPTSAVAAINKAIADVSNFSGQLGAYQSTTLEANAENLTASLQNTSSAESVVQDTNYSSEIANFTKLQTQLQAGSTVLGNANQTSQLISKLLGG